MANIFFNVISTSPSASADGLVLAYTSSTRTYEPTTITSSGGGGSGTGNVSGSGLLKEIPMFTGSSSPTSTVTGSGVLITQSLDGESNFAFPLPMFLNNTQGAGLAIKSNSKTTGGIFFITGSAAGGGFNGTSGRTTITNRLLIGDLQDLEIKAEYDLLQYAKHRVELYALGSLGSGAGQSATGEILLSALTNISLSLGGRVNVNTGELGYLSLHQPLELFASASNLAPGTSLPADITATRGRLSAFSGGLDGPDLVWYNQRGVRLTKSGTLAVTGSNIGTGAGVYLTNTSASTGDATVLQFKSLVTGSNITINTTATTIEISASAGSSFTNTGSLLSPTTTKTANYQAVIGDMVIVSASSDFVVTAPTNVRNGDRFGVSIVDGYSILGINFGSINLLSSKKTRKQLQGPSITQTFQFDNNENSWIVDTSTIDPLLQSFIDRRTATTGSNPTLVVSYSNLFNSGNNPLEVDFKITAMSTSNEDPPQSLAYAMWRGSALFNTPMSSSGQVFNMTASFINFDTVRKASNLTDLDVGLVPTGSALNVFVTGSTSTNITWHSIIAIRNKNVSGSTT